jgi:hypothetical protein
MKNVDCWRAGLAVVGMMAAAASPAVDSAYAKKLERSGCTQVTELQGCDINKTKAENAKAGFGTAAPAAPATPATPAAAPAPAGSPYAGQWVARSGEGRTVATIRIDPRERVWVNGKPVQARRTDGALQFRDGTLLFTIQGDRRIKGEDRWQDTGAGTSGPIVVE